MLGSDSNRVAVFVKKVDGEGRSQGQRHTTSTLPFAGALPDLGALRSAVTA
jgi:hypothetical protein